MATEGVSTTYTYITMISGAQTREGAQKGPELELGIIHMLPYWTLQSSYLSYANFSTISISPEISPAQVVMIAPAHLQLKVGYKTVTSDGTLLTLNCTARGAVSSTRILPFEWPMDSSSVRKAFRRRR
jgi:hypothetical protein